MRAPRFACSFGISMLPPKFYWRLLGFGYELSHDQACACRRGGVDRCLLAGRSAARESAGGNESSNDYASTIACWQVQFCFGTEPLPTRNFQRERYFPSAS